MFSTHEYALYVYTVPINTAYKSAIQGCARMHARPHARKRGVNIEKSTSVQGQGAKRKGPSAFGLG